MRDRFDTQYFGAIVTGKVYLVGAGPGNLDYLTLKAKKLIESAEVLIYDALVEERLLNLVPAECLKLNVSKRGGQKSTPQAQINQMLIAYCLQGKRVVRLKSGDPSIFGRATEEIQALNEAGCFWEIVPGISSALAAPLLEGIPLTDRLLSNAFAVFSAHDPAILNWDALTQLDTLVILMGGNSLKEIIRQLLQRGRDVRENIAIVRNCSRRDRQVWQGTLKDILETVGDRSLSPAVIIIGKVVELGQQLNPRPINTLPLSGKTILVTRAADRSSQFTELLEEQGAEVIEMPALEIRPPSSWHDLDFAIENLSTFTWLILTSANGVDYFFSRLQALGKDARVLSGVKIAVVGQKTALTLKQYNLQADFIPPNFVADSLVENFPEAITGKKILFPRVETGGRDVLVRELRDRGANVVEVAAYESGCPLTIDPVAWQALQEKRIDAVTFASSKTVQNFHRLIQTNLNNSAPISSLLENVCIASIGPQTSKTCYELLGRVDVEAKEYTLEGLTESLVESIRTTVFVG